MEAHRKAARLISQIWENKNFKLLKASLADDVQWFEGSYAKPLTTPDAVVQQWEDDLSNQEDIKAPTKVLGANGSEGYYRCIASWSETNKHREMDGIFLVRLTDGGKIGYFNSWWSEKPQKS